MSILWGIFYVNTRNLSEALISSLFSPLSHSVLLYHNRRLHISKSLNQLKIRMLNNVILA